MTRVAGASTCAAGPVLTRPFGAGVIHKAVSDGDLLDEFRATHDVAIDVAIADQPQAHAKAKVEAVYVALVGAKAKAFPVNVVVEHSGQCIERVSERETTRLLMQPRTMTVLAGAAVTDLSGSTITSTHPTSAIWGRPAAATWRISIDGDELDRAGLDLAALERIDVQILYRGLSDY
jgi:hypothetical protein